MIVRGAAMENRPEERNELIARAGQALEHPNEIEPRGDLHRYRLYLRLWRYPAFEPWISWAIFEPGRYADDVESFHVRQITWNQQYDLSRFAAPMEWLRQGYRTPPTLDVADMKVSCETLKPYLDELARAHIPLLPSEGYITLDGEELGIETYGFSALACIVWRPGTARDTPAVVRSLERLMDLLQSICQDSESD